MVLLVLLRHRVELSLPSHQRFPGAAAALAIVPVTARTIFVIGTPNDDHGTNTMVDAVITDAPKPALGGSPGRAEAAAPHDDGAEAQPLHLQAKPLLHVVVLHYVDFERDLSLHQGLSQVRGLRGREGVEVVLQLPLRLLGGGPGRVDVEVNGAPVGAVEYARGPHVEEDHGVAGTEVVLHGPSDGEGALVAQVDGDRDFAVVPGDRRGRWGEARGGRLDVDRRRGRNRKVRFGIGLRRRWLLGRVHDRRSCEITDWCSTLLFLLFFGGVLTRRPRICERKKKKQRVVKRRSEERRS